jgi:DNA repair ATPase RecN
MPRQIEEARNTAARFYKADLHLHSPLSFDWNNDKRGGYEPNPLLNRISTPEAITDEHLTAYYQFLESASIDVAAITDHMKWSFGVALAEFVQKKRKPILILPGIEINAKFNTPLLNELRIHIIAIFPPDIGKVKIDKIFPGSFPDEFQRNGKTEEVEYRDIEDLIKSVHSLNGYVIAAHIYGPNGIRLAYTKQAELILSPIEATEPKERDEFYRRCGDKIKDELFKFDCLQVTETTNPIHFQKGDEGLAIPLICATDSHHVCQFGDPGRITYIKMGALNINCLREAFDYPDTRIRFKGNLPESKPPRIRGLRIVGRNNDEKSFFKNLVIGFSDNLTCFIGPRGSGKSAIIDGIRYVMGYNRTLDEIKNVQNQVIERQKNTLHASRIEILYEKVDSTVHKLIATYDEKEDYNTKVNDLDDNLLNIDDVEASGEYPLNLYGWNELELLGEDPEAQRDSLDRFIRDLPQLKQERAGLYEKLNNNTTACDQQMVVLDKFFDPSLQKTSFTRLKEFEKEFNKLNTPEMEKIFQHMDSISHKLSFLAKVKSQVKSTIDKLQSISSIPIDSLLAKQKDEKEWCINLVHNRLQLRDFNDLTVKHRAELVGKLQGNLNILDETQLELESERNEISKKIKEAVGEEESISADLRNNAKKRLDAATEQFNLYKAEISCFDGLLKQRYEIISNVKSINERIFATRHREISNITDKIRLVEDDTFKIGLQLEQEKDRTGFSKQLQENSVNLTFDGQWKRRKIPELLCDKFTPLELSNAILNQNKEEILHNIVLSDGEVAQTYSISDEYAEKFMSLNRPFEEILELNTKRYLRDKMRVLFSIEQISFDDAFYIQLNGRPIQKCSPGQRCSAMLPIVTLTSDAPIIIDQPEDNLDNRLVSRAVFRILAKLKETRQIVLATHNPNILVSGDSEQVVVLKNNGEVEDLGSIDKPSIVANIIELMEGGKEAFERRRKKYDIAPRARVR